MRESSGECAARFRKCVAHPICLALPDLFQDRLAKLTEHAAHVDMIIGAVAQHVLRVRRHQRYRLRRRRR